jgi:hypothetical protein
MIRFTMTPCNIVQVLAGPEIGLRLFGQSKDDGSSTFDGQGPRLGAQMSRCPRLLLGAWGSNYEKGMLIFPLHWEGL